jgi:hypothetical protein
VPRLRAREEARVKWESARDEFRRRRAELQQELDKLKEAGDDGWLHMKEGAKSAWKSLSDAFRDAAEQVEKK